MFKKTEKDLQLNLFDSPSMHLGNRASKKYEDPTAWHNLFFKLITSSIDEDIFKPLFPQGKKSGRPTASIRILVAMSVLKEGFGCSDEDLFEKCEFDLLTRKALGLISLSDVPPSLDTYYLFRRRLCEYANKNNEDLMEKCFKQIVGSQVQILKISGKCIRMDSKLIGSNIAKISRYELIHHTVVNFLKNVDISILSKDLEDKAKKYLEEDSGKTVYRSDNEVIQNNLYTLGKFINELLSVYQADCIGFSLLQRLFDEQYIIEDNTVKLRDKKTIKSDSLQSPHDPDASFRNKNGQKVSGFVTNITETVEDDKPSLITSVQTESVTYSDNKFLEDAVISTQQVCKCNVKQIYADGAYQSPYNRRFAEENGISLTTGKIQGARRHILQRDENDDLLVTDTVTNKVEKAVCITTNKRGKIWRIALPNRNGKNRYRYFTEEEIKSSELRQKLANIPPEELNKRNNVEAAMFQYSFHTRNGKTRYRGLLKHRIHAYNRCLWMNLRRIVIFIINLIFCVKLAFRGYISRFYSKDMLYEFIKTIFNYIDIRLCYNPNLIDKSKNTSF